jgi:hypothetical protein
MDTISFYKSDGFSVLVQSQPRQNERGHGIQKFVIHPPLEVPSS